MQHFNQLTTAQRESLLEQVAEHCHEANRHYKESIDEYGPCWAALKRHQRRGLIEEVRFYTDAPEASAESSHGAWRESMTANGWACGSDRCHSAKTHPGLVEFDQLPEAQRNKAHLFRSAALAVINQRLALIR